MKQIFNDLKKGDLLLKDLPVPSVKPETIIVETKKSLISTGTERTLIEFGQSSYLNKALKQPERVSQVLDKISTDGLMPTIEAVRSKLNEPMPLGYSNVGVVKELDTNIKTIKIGDRIVSNGYHAEVVRVPRNLCSKIPENVTDEEAAFTVLSSIGLQGTRLLSPSIGELVVVIGAGILGLLTIQILKANGCKVLAVDIDQSKLDLAKEFGAHICNSAIDDDPISAVMNLTENNGADGVIITASSESNEILSQAAKMSKKRGKVILVGVIGPKYNRSEFYDKELSFQVSCSYGPGRGDPQYENKGVDYPFGLVRWTAKRNFDAVLHLMSEGKLNIKPLISKRFNFEDVADAYNEVSEDKSTLGIILDYDNSDKNKQLKTIKLSGKNQYSKSKVSIGFIGAGNYSKRTLIPAFKKTKANLHTIASQTGMSSVVSGESGGFINATSNIDAIIENEEINTVVIATRHNSHAELVIRCLEAGKHIFVEKPLALNHDELKKIKKAYKQASSKNREARLMVGFNRRFSPQVKRMKHLLQKESKPKSFIMTMNSGYIPNNHWVQDISIGGGRIIGEACHYIDLMRFLAGSPISNIQSYRMGNNADVEIHEDKASILLGFNNGSFGVLNYFSNGSSKYPKERIEVFSSGSIIQLNNFRQMKGFDWKGFSKMNLFSQNKGNYECVQTFVNSIVNGDDTPIPIEEIFEVADASITVSSQLRDQKT